VKQYRITAADFVLPGETLDDNAVMHPDDLAEIKRLAGIMETAPGPGGLQGPVGGVMDGTPNSTEYGISSPVGSNISYTASERNALMSEYHAKPGSDLWFIINFSKPFMTGSLRDQIEKYLDKHPEYRQRPLPGEDS
jgi:hypothetical protein